MNLDQQIQALVDQAPQDGVTPQTIQTISPILKAFAEQLRHPQYFILQNLNDQWVMLTQTYQQQPEQTKTFIYAYPTLQDASTGSKTLQDPQILALPVPVTHILFQMLSMKPLDSIIFFDNPGNVTQGLEVRRKDVESAIQLQLQQSQVPSQVPPDIA